MASHLVTCKLDTGDVAMLTLLDLSAAFDIATLLRRLKVSYGFCANVLGWFQSYLDGRTQYVRRGSSLSPSPFFCMEFHRDRSLDPSCSCCTRRTCCGWSSNISSAHICTLTTRRYTAPVIHQQHCSSRSEFLCVSTRWHSGCGATGSS